MRYFISLSLFVHFLSIAYFIWHTKKDAQHIEPPHSTMVQIISSREEDIEKPAPQPKQKKIFKADADKDKTSEQKPKTAPKPIQNSQASELKNLRQGQFDRPSKKELTYAQELHLFIEKHRRYPIQAQRLKQEGTAVISLVILKNGTFEKIQLVESSGYKILDSAALKTLKSLERFNPLPNQNLIRQEFVIPMFYKVRNR